MTHKANNKLKVKTNAKNPKTKACDGWSLVQQMRDMEVWEENQ